MVYLNPTILGIVLNINGLYTTIKRQGHSIQSGLNSKPSNAILQQSLKDLAMLISREILVKNIIKVIIEKYEEHHNKKVTLR